MTSNWDSGLRLLDFCYRQRRCFMCDTPGVCSHREPVVELAILAHPESAGCLGLDEFGRKFQQVAGKQVGTILGNITDCHLMRPEKEEELTPFSLSAGIRPERAMLVTGSEDARRESSEQALKARRA